MTLLYILRDDRPNPFTQFTIRERLRQHVFHTCAPSRLGRYLRNFHTLFSGLNLPENTGKIVVFGLGRSLAEGNIEARITTKLVESFQNIIVCLVRGVLEARRRQLGGRHNSEIPCFVQNDAYQDVDARFHPVRDIRLLDDPLGFLEVDETTVVVAINPYLPVRQIITDIARPAVLIVSKLEEQMPWHFEPVEYVQYSISFSTCPLFCTLEF